MSVPCCNRHECSTPCASCATSWPQQVLRHCQDWGESKNVLTLAGRVVNQLQSAQMHD
nr:MAG TPA: hypothetical protein [Caudoviricetes sp.]